MKLIIIEGTDNTGKDTVISNIMKKYAIWKDHKVIGYVDIPEESAKQLNRTKDIGIYLGFDKTTAPEKYEGGKDDE